MCSRVTLIPHGRPTSPLVSSVYLPTHPSRFGNYIFIPAARSMPLGPPVLGPDTLGCAFGLDISLSGRTIPPKHTSASVWFKMNGLRLVPPVGNAHA